MRRLRTIGLITLAFLGTQAAWGPEYDDRETVSSLISDLDTGNWNQRIHAVHMLGFAGDAGKAGLAIAAQDGDWQVRMAVTHALFPLGEGAASILRLTIKNDPCRVVRLLALHNIGALVPAKHESAIITQIFTDPPNMPNLCTDQPGPGRMSIEKSGAEPTPQPLSPPHRKEQVGRVPPEPPRPTKEARYAELDALLWGAKENFPNPTVASPPQKTPTTHAFYNPTPEHLGVKPAWKDKNNLSPENRMTPQFPLRHEEKSIEAPLLFMGDRGGKATYDAVPALIAALRKGNSQMRARAADELGKIGMAASEAVQPLIAAMRDKSPKVRASAGFALGNIGAASDSAVPLLIRALNDKTVDVRYSAATALLRIPTPAAHKAFHRYVREELRQNIEQSSP